MTMRVMLGIRLEVDLAQKVKEQAEKENRSVNNLIETIIKQYLEQKEKEAKQPLFCLF